MPPCCGGTRTEPLPQGVTRIPPAESGERRGIDPCVLNRQCPSPHSEYGSPTAQRHEGHVFFILNQAIFYFLFFWQSFRSSLNLLPLFLFSTRRSVPQTWGLAATCRFSFGFHAAVQTTLPEPVSSPEGGKRVCSCPFLWEPSRIALLGLFPSAETCVPDRRRTRPPSLCTFSARPRRVVYALAEINESSALVSVSGLSCLHETKAPHLPAPTGPARARQCEPLHLRPFSVLTRCLNLTETPPPPAQVHPGAPQLRSVF